MEYGNKILDEVIAEIQSMTSEEYEKLHQEACKSPDIEGIIGSEFTSEINYVRFGYLDLCEFVYSAGVDVNVITTAANLNVSSVEVTIDQPGNDFAKAA